MEIFTVDLVMFNNLKREPVTLYFKDREAAEEYLAEYVDGITVALREEKEESMGYTYYNDNEFWTEINCALMQHASSRSETQRVKVIDPTFYQVSWIDNEANDRNKLYRSKAEALDKVSTLLGNAVGGIEVSEIPLDRIIDTYENL